MRANKGWDQEGLTHEQLVAGLRAYIHNFQKIELQLRSSHPSEKQEPLAPEAVVRQKLDWESGTEDPEKGEYYATLRYAWDALTYDRLKPGFRAETLAGSTLSAYHSHHRAEGSPHPEVVKLEDPIQVRMVDALTEVAGVPHERGQTEVIIPEKLRNYSKWVLSQEYQDRLKAGTSRPAAEPPQEHHRHQQATIEQQSSAGRTTGGAAEGRHVEPGGFATAFWDKIIETSSVSPSGEAQHFGQEQFLISLNTRSRTGHTYGIQTRKTLPTNLLPWLTASGG